MVLRLSDIKRAFHFKVAESDPGSGLGQSGFNEKMVGSAVTEAGKDRNTGDGRVVLCSMEYTVLVVIGSFGSRGTRKIREYF